MKGTFKLPQERSHDGMVDTVSLNTAEGANMKVVSWDLYRMRRQARLNGGHTMPLGMAGETPAAEQRSRTQPASSDRIRIDCLHRYVKAQLLPKSTK